MGAIAPQVVIESLLDGGGAKMAFATFVLLKTKNVLLLQSSKL